MSRAAQAEREVREALERHGAGSWQLEPISGLGESKGRRWAFRARAPDGGSVKARHLETPEEARALCVLRAGLEPAFAPVLACHGAVVIEEWVEGEPPAPGAEDWAAQAGALLGRLHARPAEGFAAGAGPRLWLDTAHRDLAVLCDGGWLGVAEAEGLRARLDVADLGEAMALIHRDFCAENMIIDVQGRLRVIDNEWLTLGPPAFDLGRTRHRWPLTAAGWERFLDGYRAEAGEPEQLELWTLVATLFGARVFAQVDRKRLDPLLSLLREQVAA